MNTRIKRIFTVVIIATVLIAAVALACGDSPKGQPTGAVVQVQTKYGTRCGRTWVVGPFKSADAAQAWADRQPKGDPNAPNAYVVRDLYPPL
jgi:hypothetical protein